MSLTSRVDELDSSLMDYIHDGGASSSDRRSLLAIHAAIAARGDFSYLEVGSYHGASLQTFIADPRCRSIISIDRRDPISPDRRPGGAEYPDNTTTRMLELLGKVPGADLEKLTTIEGTIQNVEPAQLRVDLCFIDAQHTNAAVIQDARFCRSAVGDQGVIVFHDRVLVDTAIQRFLDELPRYRAYPLAHDLFVVEINVPSLLADPRVRAQIPGGIWLAADRLRAVRVLLRIAPAARSFRRGFARLALTLGAPRRLRCGAERKVAPHGPVFEIHTFVNDDDLYERMRKSFIAAGFSVHSFVRLTDTDDDPYKAISRIGRDSAARYPVLCHQDVLADQGAGAAQLQAALRHLDATDPSWVVAGNAGVMRSGRLLRQLVDVHGGSTGDSLPLPVVTLDENFLVLNPRNAPHCSPELSDFHFYGADVCLHALSSGGSAYVIDFPVTHLSNSTASRGASYWSLYERARQRFRTVWNDRCLFRYVLTPSDALFLSRSQLLRRIFGSPRALASVARCCQKNVSRRDS